MEVSIIEGNKLIAEFMAEVIIHDKYVERTTNAFGTGTNTLLPITYHSSWDWLMPVCKKIIEMYKDNRQDIFTGLQECDIEKTFTAVVKFIEWWNDPKYGKIKWSNVPFPYNPMPKGRIL